MLFMHGLLFLLVSLGAVFCLQDQVEESLDACPGGSAPLNWPLGTWSPRSAPAQGAKELLGLLRCVPEQGMPPVPDRQSSAIPLLSNQRWAMAEHRAL